MRNKYNGHDSSPAEADGKSSGSHPIEEFFCNSTNIQIPIQKINEASASVMLHYYKFYKMSSVSLN